MYMRLTVCEDSAIEGGKGQEIDVFDSRSAEWPDFKWSTGFAPAELLVGTPQKN